MPPAVHTRPDRVAAGATIASRWAADVYSLPVHRTTADAVHALAVHPEALPTCPTRTLDPFAVSRRAPGPPRAQLAHRVLSP